MKEKNSTNSFDTKIVSSADAILTLVEHDRISTGIDAVDALLGGKKGKQGIVPGSIVLLGGYPGIGKSTLASQIGFDICETNPDIKILYASGEESVEKLGERFARLECAHENFKLLTEKSVDKICSAASMIDASVLIIDSTSSVTIDECKNAAGSISQAREIGHYLSEWCDNTGIAAILVSHVDKHMRTAGPKAFEPNADAVFIFMSPSKKSPMRSLGCDRKNTFGDTEKEIYFKMTDRGFKSEI